MAQINSDVEFDLILCEIEQYYSLKNSLGVKQMKLTLAPLRSRLKKN